MSSKGIQRTGAESKGNSVATEPKGDRVSVETCTLETVPNAGRAEVVRVGGGRRAICQLAQLGIAVGAQLHVCGSAPWGGPILVEVNRSTVAVGRGMARKVVVRLLP